MSSQGILPTLIMVCVHFDLVPGTAAARTYANKFGSASSTHVALDTIVSTVIPVTPTTNQLAFGTDVEGCWQNDRHASCESHCAFGVLRTNLSDLKYCRTPIDDLLRCTDRPDATRAWPLLTASRPSNHIALLIHILRQVGNVL
jgi:hypothetical protein